MELNLKFIKIGSGDFNNIPFMRYIADKNVPIIASTGMQTESTVKKVCEIFQRASTNFALLHCVSSYPTQVEDTQLLRLLDYKKSYPSISIGYSGHEVGTLECSCLAVLLGGDYDLKKFSTAVWRQADRSESIFVNILASPT